LSEARQFSGWSERNQKNRIAKFGYLGHPNNQIFSYLVIRVKHRRNRILQ
jgi:hypothetical protein